MSAVVAALDLLLSALRLVLFAGAVVVAAGAALSVAARTRRIGPFSPAARFARGTVDPLFRPMERRLLRLGGNPTNAPWWTLAGVIVGGIVLLSLLGFLRTQLTIAGSLASSGPRGVLVLLARGAFGFLQVALLVRVVSSWVRTSAWSRWTRWAFRATDWFMRPLGRVIPPLGMVDVTPIVAWLLLSWVVEPVVMSLLLAGTR